MKQYANCSRHAWLCLMTAMLLLLAPAKALADMSFGEYCEVKHSPSMQESNDIATRTFHLKTKKNEDNDDKENGDGQCPTPAHIALPDAESVCHPRPC